MTLAMMQIIETSDDNEPLTFEVGAGEVMGNKMFQVGFCSFAAFAVLSAA